MPKKIKSQPSATAVPTAPAPPTESAIATRTPAANANKAPRNHRELAQAIFEECDAVAIGRELLGPNNERASNSVKARIWETLVDFLFGKLATPGSASAEPKVRIVWDLPAPPHEKTSRNTPSTLRFLNVSVRGEEMSTTSTTTAGTTTTPVASTPTKLQQIGLIVELCGGGAFLAGTVLSIHHYTIGAFFVGGAAAFFVGRKLHKS